MPGLDKAKWAGRINVQEDVYVNPVGVYHRRQAAGLEPTGIAKLLEENPIAFAVGAAVLAFVAVRALR